LLLLSLSSLPTRRSSDLIWFLKAHNMVCITTMKFGMKMTHYKNDKKSVSYVRDKETLFYCIGNYKIETLWITSHMEDIHFRLQRSEEHTSELQSRFDLVC